MVIQVRLERVECEVSPLKLLETVREGIRCSTTGQEVYLRDWESHDSKVQLRHKDERFGDADRDRDEHN